MKLRAAVLVLLMLAGDSSGRADFEALYQEDGQYRYQNGWHVSAFIAAGIGALFSSILPNFTTILPSWWGVYGWFFGVAIGGGVYYALRSASATKAATKSATKA